MRGTAQWPVGGISDADFVGFLAFFAARFSFRVLACFLRSSLWADLLAMRPSWLYQAMPCPIVRAGTATGASAVRRKRRPYLIMETGARVAA